ncbi:hypothetical protein FBU30_005994 [Linnemannia zychae]|nr:hypothetical protein FBU30_005994 [Linnemannia zychae]
MATVGLRVLRTWMILITFINLAFVISTYAEDKYWNITIFYLTGKPYSGGRKELFWQDWTEMICSAILFLAYVYAFFVRSTRLHKYLRAFLMAIPAILLLFVSIQYVHLVIKSSGYYDIPFDCSRESGRHRLYCGARQFTFFWSIVVGLFALVEIIYTIVKGPMQPKGATYLTTGIYSNSPDVELVRPPELLVLQPPTSSGPPMIQIPQSQWVAFQEFLKHQQAQNPSEKPTLTSNPGKAEVGEGNENEQPQPGLVASHLPMPQQSIPFQQFDQRPPENLSATAPYNPLQPVKPVQYIQYIPMQQQFDQGPPMNSSITSTQYNQSVPMQQQFDQRPPVNTSIPSTQYNQNAPMQQQFDQRPPLNTTTPYNPNPST